MIWETTKYLYVQVWVVFHIQYLGQSFCFEMIFLVINLRYKLRIQGRIVCNDTNEWYISGVVTE